MLSDSESFSNASSQDADKNLPQDIREEMQHIRKALRKYTHRRRETRGSAPHYAYEEEEHPGPPRSPLPAPSRNKSPPLNSDVGRKWHQRLQETQQQQMSRSAGGAAQGRPSHPPVTSRQSVDVGSVAFEVQRVQLRNAKEKLEDLEKRLTESQNQVAEYKRKVEAAGRTERVKSAEAEGKMRQMQTQIDTLRLEVERAVTSAKDTTARLHEGVNRERASKQQALEELRTQGAKELEALRQESAMERQQLRVEKERLAAELKTVTHRCKSLDAALDEVRAQKEATERTAQEALQRAKTQMASAGEEIQRLSVVSQSTEALKQREMKLSQAVRELLDGMEETLRRNAVHEEEYRRGNLELQNHCVAELSAQAKKMKMIEDKARKYKQKAKESSDAVADLQRELQSAKESAIVHETHATSLQQRFDGLTDQHRKLTSQYEDATLRARRAEEDLSTSRRRCAQLERSSVEVEGTLHTAKASQEAKVHDAERRLSEAMSQNKILQEAWEAEKASLMRDLNALRRTQSSGTARAVSPHPQSANKRPPPVPPADADNTEEDDDDRDPISQQTKALLEKQMKHVAALGGGNGSGNDAILGGGYSEQMASYKQRIQELVQEIHGDEREMAQFATWAKSNKRQVESSSSDGGSGGGPPIAPQASKRKQNNTSHNDSRESIGKKKTANASSGAGGSAKGTRPRAR